MHRLHIVPEISEANGVYQVARMLAHENGGDVVDVRVFLQSSNRTIEQFSEIWVHGMWLPREWLACWKVIRAGKKLVRMTHGSLSPIYLERQGKWKKKLVAPIERLCFRLANRVVVTCEAEKKWCEKWGLGNEFEILDLKRFFNIVRMFEYSECSIEKKRNVHLLYLGRRHPLKGVNYLIQAVKELNQSFEHSEHSNIRTIDLRIVSDHFGEELEKDWAWCDALVLPTLSENFGLVVAEALERGKRVIVTDGAPAWAPPPPEAKAKGQGEQWRDRLIYLRGYRDGTDEERVELLKEAIERFMV